MKDVDIQQLEYEDQARYAERCKHEFWISARYLRDNVYGYEDLPDSMLSAEKCDDCGTWREKEC